jgi:hemerythrin-like metal-binding protein
MIVDPSKYMTGIPVIDKQHKQYIALVNQLVAKHQEGSMTKPEFIDYINEIVNYTLEHFEAEEFLMRSIKHPLYEKHLAKHDAFRDKMDNFLERIDTKEIDTERDVKFLCEWLIDWFKMQVLDDDIKLAKFIKENNIVCD